MFPILEKTDFTEKGTVGYYFAKMMRVRKLREGSRECYYHNYQKHIKQYENYSVNEITVGLLREWVASLTISPASIRLIANIFSQILDEAMYDNVIPSNPFSGKKVQRPKVKEYEPEPFSDTEVILLMNNAEGWFKNFLGILFLTGMRIGEACALKWDDITSQGIRVDETMTKKRLGDTKTGNVRFIPLFNDLRPFIKSQRLITQKGLLFPEAGGPENLHNMWRRFLKKCGIEHKRLYNARHTFAIKALDSGKFKASHISRILGHASTKMLFTKYAKWIKSEQMEIDLNFSTLDTNLGTEALGSPKIRAVS